MLHVGLLFLGVKELGGKQPQPQELRLPDSFNSSTPLMISVRSSTNKCEVIRVKYDGKKWTCNRNSNAHHRVILSLYDFVTKQITIYEVAEAYSAVQEFSSAPDATCGRRR
ncbi:unnamed protein product [Rotaria socialis]|uniref:Uncharacterized protein n=1 Tax=Rotaria socialis TaxID=392032 RepID=A0A820XUL2_9BILA|nr:unnamed protein product [Rotaria socialis]CAF4534768.1 unnamed protein product [Rotaria socialis]CAF4593811.1 unnamed protein product [Rotaria socialis]CAF4879012.1 unnamed protein product [Rotaria socialis]